MKGVDENIGATALPEGDATAQPSDSLVASERHTAISAVRLELGRSITVCDQLLLLLLLLFVQFFVGDAGGDDDEVAAAAVVEVNDLTVTFSLLLLPSVVLVDEQQQQQRIEAEADLTTRW